MKYCLSELYRKVSAQIRKEIRMKEAQGRLNLYKYYIPLVVSAISESIKLDVAKLEQAFTVLAEKHVRGELADSPVEKKEDKITGQRLEEEAEDIVEIDGQVTKSHKEQIAVNVERKRGNRVKTRMPHKKKIPETLQKFEKREQDEAQTTLDKVVENAKPKGRKTK
jgi:DNA topoisomerase-6 subunit B